MISDAVGTGDKDHAVPLSRLRIPGILRMPRMLETSKMHLEGQAPVAVQRVAEAASQEALHHVLDAAKHLEREREVCLS